ncbi:MAG: hypothetical protein KZQ84_16340 [Candidatus Thiodiazotropha sp. (ex Lucinoma borealis)]|nr:hypothetical protein [Candidatus Thiodiazotropha sp. (ex Lucinoma borealis)]
MNTYQRLFAITALILLGVFFSGPLFAEHLELNWTNSTTRTDGTAFDAETELASVEVGCGGSLTGPFDVYRATVTNEAGQPAPTQHRDNEAPSGLVGCVAILVDTGGRVSDPSNVSELVYVSPIEALRDFGQRCYGSCPGVVNFNFQFGSPAP